MIYPKLIATAVASILITSIGTYQSQAATFGDFDYTDNGTSITINEHTNWERTGTVVVPSTIDGKPVTTLGPLAFYRSKKITAITFGSSLVTVGHEAFYGCSSLGSVTFAPGLVSLGRSAFFGCESLSYVQLPEGLTTLGESCFSSASSLKSIHLPSTLTDASAPFNQSSSLEKVTFGSGITVIPERLLYGCVRLKNLVIPPTVERIGKFAFYRTAIPNISLPAGLLELGEGAFSQCNKLERVELPANLTEIPDSLFFNCTELKALSFSDSLTRIGSKAFFGCRLEVVRFPAGIKQIGTAAFAENRNLQTVVFTGKVPVVGSRVFNAAATDFTIFLEDSAHGFTLPRWKGYRATLPRPEISLISFEGTDLVTGAKQSFPPCIVGKNGSDRNFTILNSGIRPLTNLTVTIQGGDAADFTVKTLKKTSLAPGKSITLRVKFYPLESGKRRSQLRIGSNDSSENPYLIDLIGTGLRQN